jgi:heme-degrading monooxygenase HmoA
MSEPARTPRPPYFAVVFTSVRTAADPNGYGAMADRMEELAARQPGFLGIESARGTDGLGITVSYWSSLEAIRDWKQHAEHQVAQARGRSEWYARFVLRVCRVESDSEFSAEDSVKSS